jgi:NADH-quinone oxidoreductase subunit H
VVFDWFLGLHPFLQALIRVLLVVVPILTLVPGIIWWERRLLSWMQDRVGPNRVGNITFSRRSRYVPNFLKGKKIRLFGLLQPIADGVKLFLKEDMTPASVDKAIYFIAPAVALFPAFALGGTLPWGPIKELTPIADVNIGILFVLAISSLGVYGVVLAGYSANNKYSLMGGLRASAQLISYELAMGMSLAAVVLATGSLKITEMVKAQEEPLYGFFPVVQNWFAFTPFGFVAMIIFLICMVAETNRAPFDLPEAENELIAGYHTEYSSMKFAVFFMGEYAAMFTFSGVLSAVFLGGYNILPIRWEYLASLSPGLAGLWNTMAAINHYGAPLWFIGKIVFFLSFYIWLRATLPRLRYDQLMSLGWKSLLPLATANFMLVAVWILATRLITEQRGQLLGQLLGWAVFLVAAFLLFLIYKAIQAQSVGLERKFEVREVTLVDPAKPATESVS